jgi:adenosine kinase
MLYVTGSIAYDLIATYDGIFAHAATLSGEHLNMSVLLSGLVRNKGGTAANICYGLAQLNVRSVLIGAVGRDFDDYRGWLEHSGIDTKYVRQFDEELTGMAFIISDNAGNQISSFYPGAMKKARLVKIPTLTEQDLVSVSANDPDAMHIYCMEAKRYGARLIFDPGQQTVAFGPDTLKYCVENADYLLVNQHEWQIMQRMLGDLSYLSKRLKGIIITLGKNGALFYEGNYVETVNTLVIESPIDPTGAGDAFRAGFLAGLVNNLGLKECVRLGCIVSGFCVESPGTQNYVVDVQALEQRYKIAYGEPLPKPITALLGLQK